MWTNLVLVKNYTERKVEPVNYTEEAELAGARFIRLEHNVGAAQGEFYQRGFQRVDLTIEQAGNRVVHRYALSKKNGEDADGLRRLVFRPDARTGVQMGFVPDTPYNRKLLVSHYYHGACWAICDKNLDAEIKALADAAEVGIKKEKLEKDTVAELSAKFERQQEEVEALKEQLENEKRLKKVILEERAPVRAPAPEPAPAPIPTPLPQVQPEAAPVVKPKNKGGRPRKVRPNADNSGANNQPTG